MDEVNLNDLLIKIGNTIDWEDFEKEFSHLFSPNNLGGRPPCFHAPEVCYIAKGKLHKLYEFVSKVCIPLTHKQDYVLVSNGINGSV